MRNTRVDIDGLAAQHAAWMNREHNRLDARLATVFLHTVWGSAPEARKEFDIYRRELAAHLTEAERRLFSALRGLDEGTRTMELFEWRAHKRDLRHALGAVQRELRQATVWRYDALGALRRAMRRHRRHEHHLLQLVGAVEPRAARTLEAFL